MKNSVLYGVLAAGIITGVVVATSDWVFAAEGTQVDYSHVYAFGNGEFTCPNQSEESLSYFFKYSEKFTDTATLPAPLVGCFFGGFGQGGCGITSGHVDTDEFAVRGLVVLIDKCGIPQSEEPVILTADGTCGLGDGTIRWTTSSGMSGEFNNQFVACT